MFTYTYNSANRPITITQGVNTNTFAYNGMGDRMRQVVNGITTTYTLDLNAGLTQVLADGTNTYLYGNGRIAQQSVTTTAYFLGDALRSVRQLTNSTGQVTLAKSYQPYGTVLSSTGTGTTSYDFAGEWRDNTGLLHLRARYLSTQVGRFITRDTWPGDYQRPASFNAWLYAYANPVNLTDPSGHYPIPNDYSRGDYQLSSLLSWLSGVERGLGNQIDLVGNCGILGDDKDCEKVEVEVCYGIWPFVFCFKKLIEVCKDVPVVVTPPIPPTGTPVPPTLPPPTLPPGPAPSPTPGPTPAPTPSPVTCWATAQTPHLFASGLEGRVGAAYSIVCSRPVYEIVIAGILYFDGGSTRGNNISCIWTGICTTNATKNVWKATLVNSTWFAVTTGYYIEEEYMTREGPRIPVFETSPLVTFQDWSPTRYS